MFKSLMAGYGHNSSRTIWHLAEAAQRSGGLQVTDNSSRARSDKIRVAPLGELQRARA